LEQYQETRAAGVPVAAAENVATVPIGAAESLVGLAVITGALKG